MSKHTPGPWVVFGDWAIHDTSGRLIAQFEPLNEDGNGNSDESFANANLIAASPDLLAVCQRLLEAVPYVSEYDVPLGVWDDLEAAVNKATGEAE